MDITDRQVIHILFAWDHMQFRHGCCSAIQTQDMIPKMQITSFDPSLGGQPGMFLSGVNRFRLAGRRGRQGGRGPRRYR